MLKLIVDTLDGVDEPLRTLYEEADGKFRLKVDGIEDTSGLKSALAAERKNAAEAAKQAAAWKALGKSPDEIKELVAAQAAADEDKAAKAGEWDKLKAQMNEKHQADLAAKDEANGKMRAALDRYLIDAQAVSAIAAARGVPELLLPHVQRQMKVIDEDGEYVARVVDAKGDLRVDGKGDPLTITALIDELKKNEIYGRAFEAVGTQGSGKKGGEGGGSAKVMTTAALNAMSPKERAAVMADGATIVD